MYLALNHPILFNKKKNVNFIYFKTSWRHVFVVVFHLKRLYMNNLQSFLLIEFDEEVFYPRLYDQIS